MHELSIVHAVVRTVVGALPDPSARVTVVRLRVGELSGVVPQALEFAFDVATAGTALAGAQLVVERAPVVVDCPSCGRQALADIRSFSCPRCAQPCGEVVGGKELEIVDITVTDVGHPGSAPADPRTGRTPEDARTGTAPEDARTGTAPADARTGTAPADPRTGRAPEGSVPAPAGSNGLAALRGSVLARNDLLAAGLRGWFSASDVRVSNWVSGPGSGKTALLEAVLSAAAARGLRPAALVGDCATDNDARRLARSGALVRQIVTDGTCHLEADMVSAHLDGWNLDALDLLAIENVGNLVCPTGFDLGEDTRIALMSVTEGEDKPLKYPQTFHRADVIVVTKVDLADAVEWDRAGALAALREVNPCAAIIETSARTGVGVEQLLDVLLGGYAPEASAPHPHQTAGPP